MTKLPPNHIAAAWWKLGAADALAGKSWQGLNDDALAGWRWAKRADGTVHKALNAHLRRRGMETMSTVKVPVSPPKSETMWEAIAEVQDPAEWAALQLTKAGKPGMTIGEAQDMTRAIIRRAIEMSELNKEGRI